MVFKSRLTGIAATATIIKDNAWGAVPGGQVFSGRWSVFYLAVCEECGDAVHPFETAFERDRWQGEHPHEVKVGIEIRVPK